MIGDSLTTDVKGVNDYGMTTIWFNKKNQSVEEITFTYTVNNLSMIKKYL